MYAVRCGGSCYVRYVSICVFEVLSLHTQTNYFVAKIYQEDTNWPQYVGYFSDFVEFCQMLSIILNFSEFYIIQIYQILLYTPKPKKGNWQGSFPKSLKNVKFSYKKRTCALCSPFFVPKSCYPNFKISAKIIWPRFIWIFCLSAVRLPSWALNGLREMKVHKIVPSWTKGYHLTHSLFFL